MLVSLESSLKVDEKINQCINQIQKALFLRKYVITKLLKKEKFYSVGLKSKETESPIKLVGFWGANLKKALDQNDVIVLNRLKDLAAHIQNSWKQGCCWTVILCDTHAIKNGFEEEGVRNYLVEVEKLLLQHPSFHPVYLSELWKEYDLEKQISDTYCEVEKQWDQLNISRIIEQQAVKHDHSNRSVVKSAQEYYAMRSVEAKCIENLYADGIFFTFSTDRLQEIYPKIPTLYLWSLKRGICNPPWLLFDAVGEE